MTGKMRVILVNPPSDCVDDDRLEPPLGLLYIAALLQENHVPVSIYDMTGCQTPARAEAKIRAMPEGDIYGFTVFCTNYAFVKQCISFIRRRNPAAFIVLGGPNPTALPEFTLTDSGCDCVVSGEGEDAFLSVVRAVAGGKEPPGIVRGLGRGDIDSYPLPARDLVDPGSYSRSLEGERAVSLLGSRGCRYRCLHCNSVVMGSGKPPRFRGAAGLADEIRDLKLSGVRKFRFNDDNFSDNPALPQVLTRLGELDIHYRIFARIEHLTEDTCRQLKQSGCRHVSVGLESLNPGNLEALGKTRPEGLVEKHLTNAQKQGLFVRCYFMVGLPFDTRETVHTYFNRAAALPFDEYSLYPLIPYPGTPIWKQPEAYGYRITDRDFTGYIQIGKKEQTCFVLERESFTTRDVRDWYRWCRETLEGGGKSHIKHSGVAK